MLQSRAPAQRPELLPAERLVMTLSQYGPQSRTQLCAHTLMAKSTVSRVMQELTDAGIVVTSSTVASTRRGRPSILMTLNPELGNWVGLDFGLHHVRAALVDVAHNVLASAEVEIQSGYSPSAALEAAKSVVDTVTAKVPSAANLVGIGAAIPGPVDPVSGLVYGTSIVPGWTGTNVGAELSEVFGREVLVDNDTNCAALAEHSWGVGRGVSDLAYFKLHSGVGGALLLNGEILRGRGGVAGEFGHVPMNPAGNLCNCGNRGCLETYASVPSLLNELSTVNRPMTLSMLTDAVSRREPAAINALAEVGTIVGQAAAAVANIASPELIVIGGALIEFGDEILIPARESFARWSVLPAEPGVERIQPSTLSRHASALGAAMLVMSKLGAGTIRQFAGALT